MSTLRSEFTSALSFPLDPFQNDALEAIDNGRNVLVSAPTGSGKTLIAQFAIWRAHRSGQRSIYTTPIKALSNQKYIELQQQFGESAVGLLTGDVSINREAAIVVMTTEVLRNMIMSGQDNLEEIAVVILDEVHFIQDPFRGGAWEETLILSPHTFQFVSLSATIGNAEEIGGWLTSVTGDTQVVTSHHRPITLHHHVASTSRDDALHIDDLLEGTNLSRSAKRIDSLMMNFRNIRPKGRYGASRSGPPPPLRPPARNRTIRELHELDLLPAIVFIFSRVGCDEAARDLATSGYCSTDDEMREQIDAILNERIRELEASDLSALDIEGFRERLLRGISAHHAGMIPAFREVVEQCFTRGLLSIVFATETLALGINMPARTVVLERFTKYSDEGKRRINATEFAQLVGRAGRRGLDIEGHVVLFFAPGLSMKELGKLALATPAPLRSSFRPTYNFTTNLVAKYPRDLAERLVSQSLAEFQMHQGKIGARRSMVDVLHARHRLLDELGYTNGWSLTDQGDQLRCLYSECDLVLVETILDGVYDNLDPRVLAATASFFAFEGRRPAAPAKGAPPIRRSDLPRISKAASIELSQLFQKCETVVVRVNNAEVAHGLPLTRRIDQGFAQVAYQWACGADLEACLDLAASECGINTPGDFIRTIKQTADIVEQISLASRNRETTQSARDALRLLERGIIEDFGVIHHF